MPETDDHEDGYSGEATLSVDGRELRVKAILDARHEPQDGRLHWFGRLVLPAGSGPGNLSGDVELSTPSGRAPGRLGDVDPWGRYRITGVGTPPYHVPDPELDDPELDG